MHENQNQYLDQPKRDKQSRTGAKSISGNELQADSSYNFDKNKLIDYYRKMREAQHQTLTTINMSEDLKKKLFGFSQGTYVTNSAQFSQLVVEDHPIRGRIIMTKEKYQHYLLAKHKERQTRINESSHNTVSKVKSDTNQKQSSSLPEKQAQKSEAQSIQQESYNDFGKLKLQSIFQSAHQ